MIHAKRQLLLLSSSNVHGFSYLEYAAQDIKDFLNRNNVKNILFIPYALKEYDAYLTKVKEVLNSYGFNVSGIHENQDPIAAAQTAQSFFVGGGNTFLLLKTLYDKNLIQVINSRVLVDGIPYIGTSAGTNIATTGIHTTNDMPIVYPPSFNALKLISFNINPHYLDSDPTNTHKGETREQRILEYLESGEGKIVLALREGGTLLVDGNNATLKGLAPAKLFVKGAPPEEIEVGTDLSYLLQQTED